MLTLVALLKEYMALPPLTPERGVHLDVLLELFFKQLMAFASYINEKPGLIPDRNYADFVVYCMQKRLDEEFHFKEAKDFHKEKS